MKVVITARDFSIGRDFGTRLLREAGLEVVDYSQIREVGAGTEEAEIYEMLRDADCAITGPEPCPASLLARCGRLRLISRRGIGYDAIDLDACQRLGITVCRALGTVEGAVAEHVMAYLLYFARRVDLQNQTMQAGRWTRLRMEGAKSRTLGLVGFGGIGREIARRAVPFGMDVVYYNRHPNKAWEREYGVRYLDLDKLLAVSDYVSVNVPLTEQTRGMFGREAFARMKRGSIFINIARSPIMEVEALREALCSGHLGGAAVDVFPHEPCEDSPLLGCPNTILTPHTAPYTTETFEEMNRRAAQNVVDFLQGRLEERYVVR